MKRLPNLVLSVLVACVFSVAALAATPKPANATTPAKSEHVTTKAAPVRTGSATNGMTPFTKAETLNGKLSMVLPNKGIIVVTNSNGVPFDFKVAHAKVDVNGSPAKENTLASMTGKDVTVRFLPFASGDFAQKITVG